MKTPTYSILRQHGDMLMLGVFLCALTSTPVLAEKLYGPGVTDSEIKIGQTMPYSGSLSSAGAIGKAEAAYFQKVNDEGGVNGRKINFISLDDGYSPPKTVEQTRRLVEQDQVLLLFGSLGTPTNSAIHKYVNDRKVPHLFLTSGATKWGDPQNFPWTMGLNPSYQSEAKIYAKYLLQNKPNAKIGILYQNDDYGKDYLKGLKDGLGDRTSKMIVSEVTYEVSDPTVDSQILTLKGSGADTFIDITSPKFAALAIRKAYDSGWRPLHFLNNISAVIGTVLQPAGLEKSVGLITADFGKDATDPQWQNDPDMKEFLAWLKKYLPEYDLTNTNIAYGYNAAHLMVQILQQCGDDLTRDNVMKQATNLKDVRLPLLLPGIKVNTSSTDYFPIKQAQLARFNGTNWVRFGDLIGP
jgi:branched-chain amino acid transport system substrate-binding protein